MVAAFGVVLEVFSGTPRQAEFSAWAAAVMGAAALGSLLVEWKYGHRGPAAILTHWFGAVLRAGALVIVGIVGNRGLSKMESDAWWLWLLTAYLVVMAVETVWLVRTLDRQAVPATHSEREQGS